MFQIKLLFITCLFFATATAQATDIYTSEKHSFRLTEIVSDLEYPWGFTFLPNGNILVTERDEGRLRIIRKGNLDPKPITGLPTNILFGGQGGLLDIEIHPNFENNQLIYISYAALGEGGGGTEVARAKLNGHALENLEVIFTVEPKTLGKLHYGSRLVFAADDTLFITTGDRYMYMQEAQNPANHLGTVIRINDDGSIPKDNPFIGKENHKPEIYSYGHRNAQGLALRPKDQVMWMHEHGPKGGDEINILDKPGANYGWPAITYGIDYSGAIISNKTKADGMEQPVIHWTPSIAPSGMAFYNGDKFPKWNDNIFVGALAGSLLARLELEGNEITYQEILLKGFGRIRDVVNGPDGYIYFIMDTLDGKIFRLEPTQQ